MPEEMTRAEIEDRPCWIITFQYKDTPCTIAYKGALAEFLLEDAGPILYAQKISREDYENLKYIEVYP